MVILFENVTVAMKWNRKYKKVYEENEWNIFEKYLAHLINAHA